MPYDEHYRPNVARKLLRIAGLALVIGLPLAVTYVWFYTQPA